VPPDSRPFGAKKALEALSFFIGLRHLAVIFAPRASCSSARRKATFFRQKARASSGRKFDLFSHSHHLPSAHLAVADEQHIVLTGHRHIAAARRAHRYQLISWLFLRTFLRHILTSFPEQPAQEES
jgi:hypothetical protein